MMLCLPVRLENDMADREGGKRNHACLPARLENHMVDGEKEKD